MVNEKGKVYFGLALAMGLLAFGLGMAVPALLPVYAVDAAEPSEVRVMDSVPYTTTGYADATYAATWDMVNIHAHVVVTGSQVTTVTVQQSGETGVNCSSATSWYTSTAYEIKESEASTDTLITLEEVHDFTVTGTGDAGRAVPVTGRCVRIKIESAAATYTPTLYMRLYNN